MSPARKALRERVTLQIAQPDGTRETRSTMARSAVESLDLRRKALARFPGALDRFWRDVSIWSNTRSAFVSDPAVWYRARTADIRTVDEEILARRIVTTERRAEKSRKATALWHERAEKPAGVSDLKE